MKKQGRILSAALAMVLAFSLCIGLPVAADTEIPIANGDFESGTTGWTVGTAVLASENAPQGSHYLKIPQNTTFLYSPAADVLPGDKYNVTLRYQCASTQVVYIYYYDEFDQLTRDTLGSLAASAEWTVFTAVFIAPAGCAYVKIGPRSQSEDALFAIDDLRLYHIDGNYNELLINGDFENGLQGITYDAACTEETVTTHGTSAKALKITNTGAASLQAAVIPGVQYYVTAYFNLTAYEGADGGAKLSVCNAAGDALYETAYFTAMDKGWRKMMLIIPTANTVTDLMITVSMAGTGAVYFDDLSLKQTDDLILNGDFEGLQSDSAFAGFDDMWVKTVPANDALVAKQTVGEDNNYVSVSGVSQQGIKSNVTLQKDKIYKLSFRYYSESAYTPFMQIRYTYMNGVQPANYYSNQGFLTETREMLKNWYTFEYYFTCYSTAADIRLMIRNTVEVLYDDVKLELLGNKGDELESIKFYRNGERVGKNLAANDTITAQYSAFATDYASTGKNVTMLTALYSVVNNTRCLEDITMQTGKASASYLISTSAYQGITCRGDAPLELSADFAIPDDGRTYRIKAFAWDGVQTMKPYISASIE